MRATNLNTGWKITDTDHGNVNLRKMASEDVDTGEWFDIAVPGDINAVMVAAGRMPDPHFGSNGKDCYWVTSRDWWYRLDFDGCSLPDTSVTELCLDGVDGHADLILNGERIGRLENAFRPYRIEVTSRLKRIGRNILLLHFDSIDSIMGGPRPDELGGWYGRRTLMRKPQFSFGWDWSLPIPSIGIAGYVRLEHHSGPRFVDVSVQTHLSGRLDFKFQTNTSARDAGYRLDIHVTGNGASLRKSVEVASRVFSHTSIHIENPRLWWPNGLGDPSLYEYSVDLVINGIVVDNRSERFGIREYGILEEPFTEEAGSGISFWLMVNRKRVFCKGGNWVPLELWPATATDEKYDFHLRRTAEANFNMLRVWGGGIYERDIFYDLCDQLGIMVWQDFMFASAGYPLEKLRLEIIREAEHQIKRLRNRPSIAIWCGCNEDIFSWALPNESAMATADTGIYSHTVGDHRMNRLRDDPQIYTMILRGLVSRYGFGVPYVESSPQSYEDAGNMPESGNCHVSCWKYAMFGTSRSGSFNSDILNQWATNAEQGNARSDDHPNLFETDCEPERFREHFEKVCSFDSEFCIQGPCDTRTIRRFLPEDHLWPPDSMWTYHIQRGHLRIPHHEQTLFIASAIFGEIDSLQKYVKYGQATHAEMMRAEFESARRDRPNNGGTMMWMLNDCWPTSNWSIIDYYQHPKPSYYAAKRACAEYLPIVFERDGRIQFFFSNDGPDSCRVDLTFGQERLDGKQVWAKIAQIDIGACTTSMFYELARPTLMTQNGDYLFVDAIVGGHALPRVTYFPDMWRHIDWPNPEIKLDVIGSNRIGMNTVTHLRVSSNEFVRFCHIVLPEEDGIQWMDDNYFDLCAGHDRVIALVSDREPVMDAIRAGHWNTEWP